MGQDHPVRPEQRDIAVSRIHIIGGPGSGKTTLARLLSARLNIPAYDLDMIAYDGGAGRKRTLDERLADVRRIVAEPAWITEGAYLWWTDDLLHAADRIIWLDPPWRVAAWRIVTRHARASLSGKNPHRGLRNLRRFLRNSRRYYRGPAILPAAPDDDASMTRAATAAILVPFKDKVILCRRTRWLQIYR